MTIIKPFDSVHLQFGIGATSSWQGTDQIRVIIQNEEFEEIKVVSCDATWRLEDSENEHPLNPKDLRSIRLDPRGESRESFILPKRLQPGCILQCNFELSSTDIKESQIDVSKYPIQKASIRIDFIILRATVAIENKSGIQTTKTIVYHNRVDKGKSGRMVEPKESETPLRVRILEEEAEKRKHLKKQMKDIAEQTWQEKEQEKGKMVTVQPRKTKLPATTQKVFVVHGHDQEMRESVARTLEKLGLEPIILHEQPNKGRTIIEKFTDYGDVSFAVVLLSPDDMGYAKTDPPKNAKPRARQNVILELGFFIGKLGRDKVLPLYKIARNFEMPSDYSGVLYTPYDDSGQWKFKLIGELQAAGYTVDANKLTKR